MKKLQIIFALSVIVLAGCASPLEHRANISSDDFIFQEVATPMGKDSSYSEDLIDSMMRKYSGYVPYVKKDERSGFNIEFPPVQYAESDIERLKDYSLMRKVGQVLRLSADLDSRTRGAARDEDGKPYSVSGMITSVEGVDAAGILATGTGQAIAASIAPGGALIPGASAGANLGAGMLLGFVIGMVDQARVESAIKGIISKQNFGERMEEATSANLMPGASVLTKYGDQMYKGEINSLSPYSVKKIFLVEGKMEFDYRRQATLLTAVGTFRGEAYKKKYPSTEGWEFRITNINPIRLGIFRGTINEQQKQLSTEVRDQIKSRTIKL